jgi:lipopolysaccharide export system protein LptC
VTSDEHVDVKLLNGTLSADKLRIIGGGEVVRFEGNVVMNLDNVPATEASGQPATSPAAPPAAPEPAAQTVKTRSGKPTGPK